MQSATPRGPSPLPQYLHVAQSTILPSAPLGGFSAESCSYWPAAASVNTGSRHGVFVHADGPNGSPQGTDPALQRAGNPVALLELPNLAAQSAFALAPSVWCSWESLDPIQGSSWNCTAAVSGNAKMLREGWPVFLFEGVGSATGVACGSASPLPGHRQQHFRIPASPRHRAVYVCAHSPGVNAVLSAEVQRCAFTAASR